MEVPLRPVWGAGRRDTQAVPSAVADPPAAVERNDMVREPHHDADVVLDQDDRNPEYALEFRDEAAQHGLLLSAFMPAIGSSSSSSFGVPAKARATSTLLQTLERTAYDV